MDSFIFIPRKMFACWFLCYLLLNNKQNCSSRGDKCSFLVALEPNLIWWICPVHILNERFLNERLLMFSYVCMRVCTWLGDPYPLFSRVMLHATMVKEPFLRVMCWMSYVLKLIIHLYPHTLICPLSGSTNFSFLLTDVLLL